MHSASFRLFVPTPVSQQAEEVYLRSQVTIIWHLCAKEAQTQLQTCKKEYTSAKQACLGHWKCSIALYYISLLSGLGNMMIKIEIQI